MWNHDLPRRELPKLLAETHDVEEIWHAPDENRGVLRASPRNATLVDRIHNPNDEATKAPAVVVENGVVEVQGYQRFYVTERSLLSSIGKCMQSKKAFCLAA